MLKILAEHHNEWVKIVTSFGAKFPEDIIQDFYINAIAIEEHKLIVNDSPNRSYIWAVLKSLVYHEKTTNFVQLHENITYENNNYDHTIDEIFEKANQVIETFNDYDKRLFEIHVNNKISGKKLAEATGINKYSIYRTIRKCKQKIKDEVKV